MKIKLIRIKEDIKEKDFPEEIKKDGWNCLRLKKKNYKKIELIVSHILNSYWTGNRVTINEIEILGRPDFFIWKNQKFFFCEFKSKNDFVSNRQLTWMFNHVNFPVAIAYVNTDKKVIKKIEKEI